MLSIQTILFPTDFSDHAEHAFPLACSLARDHQARIIVLHVYPPPPGPPGEAVAHGQHNTFQDELWNRLRLTQPSDPQIPVDHQMTEGQPAAEILRVARVEHCDLIVMATHGRSGLLHLLMGSVVEHVVRSAPCPVLTIKTPAAAFSTSTGGASAD